MVSTNRKIEGAKTPVFFEQFAILNCALYIVKDVEYILVSAN